MKRAFSLIELMVVIIILGILTALVAPNVLGRGEQAKAKLACVQMRNLAQSLEMFKMDNGVYPTTEQGLDALVKNPDPERFKNFQSGGYLSAKTSPKDPWNKPYIYLFEGDEFEMISLGGDGKEGGAETNKDLRLSECEK
ncbi:MAG: type II secretion system major pseudopilin GspG [Helicobacteraceae bacterium]|nr:type II secretion system major pseudopilin GspG [Helicobacteraceae bacterium]